MTTAPAAPVRTAVIRSDRTALPAPRRARSGPAAELVSKLSQALDPSTQQHRDDERSFRSMQASQLVVLNEQLRDANATVERLRGQNTELLQKLNAAERERDIALLRLDMNNNGRSESRSQKPRKSHWRGYPGMERSGGKIKVVEPYPEGGSYTYWVSDCSTDGSDALPWDDDSSDKENRAPEVRPRWRDCSPFQSYKPPIASSTTGVHHHSSSLTPSIASTSTGLGSHPSSLASPFEKEPSRPSSAFSTQSHHSADGFVLV